MLKSSFQTKFPGFGPSLLASLASAVDSRTMDSIFPDLVVPAAQERCGL